MTSSDSHPPSGLNGAVQAHLAQNNARVSRLEHQGAFYWVKREEGLSLRMRLQKGNAASSFETERQALHQLNALNAAVPEIIAEGPGYFVLSDSGDNLQHLLQSPEKSLKDRMPAFVAAGDALAQLHTKNISHGRPAIRDFCWKDSKITLLDFERFAPKRNTKKGHMQDLLIFAHSALASRQGITPELSIALETYRAQNPHGTWERAVDYCDRMRWVDWLTKPIQWRKPGKAKEFKAIPMVFDLFAGRDVVQATGL